MPTYKKYFYIEEVMEYVISQYKLLCNDSMSTETQRFIRGYVTGYGRALNSEGKLNLDSDTGKGQMSYDQVLKLSNEFFTSIQKSIDNYEKNNFNK